MLTFTNIQHSFRKEHKLSCNEYVLADMIYHLSVKPDAKIKGWCFMTKVTMAEELGLSKQSILNLLGSLIEKGFIEKHPETSFLKTLSKWHSVYFTDGKESVSDSTKSLPKVGKESLPYNDNIDNTINNKKDIQIFFSLSEFEETFNNFREMRKKNKKPLYDTSEILIRKQLEKLSNGNEKLKIKILEQSIMNGYQGVFPLRNDDIKNDSKFDNLNSLYNGTGT